jgi:hypothetical protein
MCSLSVVTAHQPVVQHGTSPTELDVLRPQTLLTSTQTTFLKMQEKIVYTENRIRRLWVQKPFFFLLVYIVGSPFLAPYPSLAILAHLSLSITLFVALYTVQRCRSKGLLPLLYS